MFTTRFDRKFSSALKAVAGLAVLLAPLSTSAQGVPAIIPVQGILTDASDAPLTGTYTVTFSIYEDSVTGVALYSESQPVAADQGLFTAYIGSTGSPALDLGIFAGFTNLFLGIQVEADPEMTPRLGLGTAPFAGHANSCDDAQTLAGNLPAAFATASHGHAWGELTGVPADLADGDDNTTYTPGVGLTLVSTTFQVNQTTIEGMAQNVCFNTEAELTNLLNDNYLASESDPQVGTLAANGWCQANSGGTALNCNASPPMRGIDDVPVNGEVNDSITSNWAFDHTNNASAHFTHGTIAAQNANGVNITGGAINGTPIGPSVPATGRFTTIDYATAQTSYYSVHPSALVTTNQTQSFALHAVNAYYISLTSGQSMYAPLSLPHGVTLNQLECFIWDNSGADRVIVYFRYGTYQTDTTAPELASIDTLSWPTQGAVVTAQDTINNHVVDNSRYHYWLKWFAPTASACGSNCRFYGCNIRYTATRVMP